LLDYGAVVLLALAPSLFDFGGAAAGLCYFLSAAFLGLSLLTAYPLGAAKVIPFTVHGAVEAGTAVFLVLAPFLFGFSDVDGARNFFIASGVVLGIVFALTDYKAAERPHSGARIPVRQESRT
jgi:hypothetical protein